MTVYNDLLDDPRRLDAWSFQNECDLARQRKAEERAASGQKPQTRKKTRMQKLRFHAEVAVREYEPENSTDSKAWKPVVACRDPSKYQSWRCKRIIEV